MKTLLPLVLAGVGLFAAAQTTPRVSSPRATSPRILRATPTAAAPQLPKPQTARVSSTATAGATVPTTRRANELGRIPILMYHSVGEHGAFDRHGLNIAPATFRKHLQMMVDAGWYPMNVRDLYDPEKLGAVPAGKTPVALTFDDARGSQFRYRKDGSIDPNCALGILESFHEKYNERWPRRGSFYLLPKSKYNPTPFWQAGLEKKKLTFLAESGYELGNHSYAHLFMTKMDASQVREAIWGCIRDIRKLYPDATMDTFCVPYGGYPRDSRLWEILLKDPQGKYTNRIALKAWGDESYCPLDTRFDPRQVDRFGVEPGYFEREFKRLQKGAQLYVSDGDPQIVTLPRALAKFVDKSKLHGATVSLWGPAPKAPAKKAPAAKKPQKPVVKSTAKKVSAIRRAVLVPDEAWAKLPIV